MTRIMFAFSLVMLLHVAAGKALAQNGA